MWVVYLFFFLRSLFLSFSRSFLASSMTSDVSFSGASEEKGPPGPPYSDWRVDTRDRFLRRLSFTDSLSSSLALRDTVRNVKEYN